MNRFPVFDPISLNITGIHDRKEVHTQGLWHRGIQAHLVKKNKDKGFSLFIQRRAECVDINKNKLDQSLATQMIEEDNLDLFSTLKRGLKDELNITKYHARLLPFDLRIIKKYSTDHAIKNNEILSLFLCKSLQNPDYSPCRKILEGYWIPWKKFLNFFFKHKEHFTKTSSLYLLHHDIVDYIEKATIHFLNQDDIPDFSHNGKTIIGYFPASGKHTYHYIEKKNDLRKIIRQYE